MHLTDISIKRPVTVSVFIIVIFLVGIYSFKKLNVDLLPDIEVPKLVVSTEYDGADAIEIDEKLTSVLEASLSTISEIKKISSYSRNGISTIYLEFRWGVNMDMAFIKVRSTLDKIQYNLPKNAERPLILRFDPSSMPIMTLIVTGKDANNSLTQKGYYDALFELEEVSGSLVKRRLEQIDGVANVVVSGGVDKEIQINLDFQKLLLYNIEYQTVEEALQAFNIRTYGGYIKKGDFQYPLRILASYNNVSEIEATPVKKLQEGRIIKLKDLADVKYTYKKRSGLTKLNRNEVITLYVYREADANTVKTSESVYEQLANLNRKYPSFKIVPIFDQAEFIKGALANFYQSLLLGSIFAFFVLCFFLKDLMGPFIVGIAIPLSLLIALIFMSMLNITINIISLCGLALATGLLTDNAIVVLENIHRYRELNYGRVEAAIKGTKEVSLAITASTLTTILVFFPLVYVKGVAGELFFDLAITISVSLLASLIVAITVIPLLYGKNVLSPQKTDNSGEKKIMGGEVIKTGSNFFKRPLQIIFNLFASLLEYVQAKLDLLKLYYEKKLISALKVRKIVILVAFILFVISASSFFYIKKVVFPAVENKQIIIKASLPNGLDFQSTLDVAEKLEEEFLHMDGIDDILTSVGITQVSTEQLDIPAINKFSFNIHVRQDRSSEFIEDKCLRILAKYSLVKYYVEQQQSLFSYIFKPLDDNFSASVCGTEMDTLAELSNNLTDFMKNNPYFSDVQSNLSSNGLEYIIRYNYERMIQYGISVSDINNFLKSRISGSIPTQFIDFSDKIDISIDPKHVMQFYDLLSLNYPLNARNSINGQNYISVNQILSIEPSVSYTEIQRENQRRNIAISASLNDIKTQSAERLLYGVFKKLHPSSGYTLEMGKEKEEIKDNFVNLLSIMLIAFILVFLVLTSQFESVKLPVIIIAAVPLSFIGLMLTLLISGFEFSLIVILGCIILIGIVVNDSIVKVDFINRNYKTSGNIYKSIIIAGHHRFRPIIMTTVTTICGLLPLAFKTGNGSEIARPLAWVIIGGITFATILTLFIIPILYSFFFRNKSLAKK
jgi:hydrophobic/amphiphilic exporter-1 (mainly G- bacteria), HAE1 family